MGPPTTSDLDDDFLDLLSDAELEDDGEVGVDDADELLFQELDTESEEVGLDTEPSGGAETLAALLLDIDSEETSEASEDTPVEVEADIDAEGDEHGWTDESDEAAEQAWYDGLPDELSDELGDDGGEEGVDDPLLEGLPEDLQRPPVNEDDFAEGLEDDGLDDLGRELGNDA